MAMDLNEDSATKKKEPDRVLIPGKPDFEQCDNRVISARYSALTFVPVVRIYHQNLMTSIRVNDYSRKQKISLLLVVDLDHHLFYSLSLLI